MHNHACLRCPILAPTPGVKSPFSLGMRFTTDEACLFIAEQKDPLVMYVLYDTVCFASSHVILSCDYTLKKISLKQHQGCCCGCWLNIV